MSRLSLTIALLTIFSASGHATTQEAVVAAADNDALFTSADPRLHANKQIVYHIMKDLLEANQWATADRFLTESYLQHNPQVPSGRATVVNFLTKVLKVAPTPVPAKLGLPVVSVTAEGNLVTVAAVRTLKDPREPTKSDTTTWFDMRRIQYGRVDEHWDSATRDGVF